MAEDLTEYLSELGIKVRWLHSDIKAIERVELLRDLRLGVFDVLVGVNLLREGLDLPEVTLVAIMEADKEGFLRAERSLVQTIGRAARNTEGRVIMYADKMTDSMEKAIRETNRRRTIQLAHNQEHGITPTTIVKDTGNSLLEALRGKGDGNDLVERLRVPTTKAEQERMIADSVMELTEKDLRTAIKRVEKEMKDSARELNFELAAELRDQLKVLHERSAQLRKSS
jgi:excinuclease ABC subunit B